MHVCVCTCESTDIHADNACVLLWIVYIVVFAHICMTNAPVLVRYTRSQYDGEEDRPADA